MKAESRPARRLPTNSVCREVSTRYGRNREHELDRMVVGATWRAVRAKAGLGYVFKVPEKARRARQ